MINNSLASKQAIIKLALLFLMIGFILKVAAMFAFDVNWDTNYYLNIGSYFIEDGEVTPYMWRLGADTTIIAGSGTGYGVYILTYWLKLFGLSLMSGYILMYIFGVLCLVAMFFLAREWWQSDVAGFISVTFTALTGYFISIFYIRMDAPGIFAYSLVLLLHLIAVKRGKLWLHAFAGVAAILATEIHIQAIIYIAALSFYYLIEQIKSWRNGNPIFAITPSVAFFSGAFVAGVIYLFVHVFPDPRAYFIIAQECPNCSPAGLFKEFRRFLIFVYYYSTEMLIFSFALGLSILRRSKADNHLLTILVGYLIAQAIISPPAQVEYLTHMLPLFGLCVGGIYVAKDQTSESITQKQLILSGIAATVLTLVNIVVITVNLAEPPQNREGIDYVHRYIPPDTVIMAKPYLYHEVLEYPDFMSYDSGERYGIALRDEDYGTYYERENPQVFIGEPDTDDEAIWQYLNAHNFQRVRNDLLVSEDLLLELIGDSPSPSINFNATETLLDFGNCTELSWQVDGADELLLNDEAIDTENSMEVCPLTTTGYRIDAYWVGGIESESIIVIVD